MSTVAAVCSQIREVGNKIDKVNTLSLDASWLKYKKVRHALTEHVINRMPDKDVPAYRKWVPDREIESVTLRLFTWFSSPVHPNYTPVITFSSPNGDWSPHSVWLREYGVEIFTSVNNIRHTDAYPVMHVVGEKWWTERSLKELTLCRIPISKS